MIVRRSHTGPDLVPGDGAGLPERAHRDAATEGVDAELTDTVRREALEHAEVVELRPGPELGKQSRTIPQQVQRW